MTKPMPRVSGDDKSNIKVLDSRDREHERSGELTKTKTSF